MFFPVVIIYSHLTDSPTNMLHITLFPPLSAQSEALVGWCVFTL